MVELKGHRSVGGIRASVYNAMPQGRGRAPLAAFMRAFAAAHALSDRVRRTTMSNSLPSGSAIVRQVKSSNRRSTPSGQRAAELHDPIGGALRSSTDTSSAGGS